MTQEIQTTKPAAPAAPAKPKSVALQIKDWMTAPAMQSALEAALTGYMDPGTFAAQCYLAAQDPKLANCSAESLFRAFLECAQMGLLPGAHHKHVALVPRAGVVVPNPQWQGFKFLMERQDGVKRVLPVLVHAKDAFAYVNGELTHTFDPFDDARVFEHPEVAAQQKRASQLRGGYLIIEYDAGEREYHFVPAAKIERNRLCAETQNVWKRWYPEQCLKTIIRDAWARRVISIDPMLANRVARADEVDNAALGNDPARGAGGELPAATSAGALPTGGGASTLSRTARLEREIAATGVLVSDDQLPDMAHAPTGDAAPEAPAAAATAGPTTEATATTATTAATPPAEGTAPDAATPEQERADEQRFADGVARKKGRA